MFHEYVVQIRFTRIVSAHAWVDEEDNRIQSANAVQVYLTTCRTGEGCASCMSEEYGGVAYEQ